MKSLFLIAVAILISSCHGPYDPTAVVHCDSHGDTITFGTGGHFTDSLPPDSVTKKTVCVPPGV